MGRGGKIIAAPQQGLDLGCQHMQVEGFGHKIVAAHLHGHDGIHMVGSGGEKNNGHAGAFAQFSAPMEAVEKG